MIAIAGSQYFYRDLLVSQCPTRDLSYLNCSTTLVGSPCLFLLRGTVDFLLNFFYLVHFLNSFDINWVDYEVMTLSLLRNVWPG
jgi:hypothetical protein